MDNKSISLVFLHGFAANKFIWDECAAQLAQSYSVYSVDLPGYGENSAACANLADIAKHLLTQITTPVVWVGWSLGGLIARYLANSAPSHTLGLITLASNPKFVASPDWPHGVKADAFCNLQTLFKQSPRKGLLRFFSLQSQGQNRIANRQLNLLKKSAIGTAPFVLQRDLQILFETDLRNQPVAVPELNIFGSEDPLVPISVTGPLKDLYPHAQNATILGAGHVPFLSHAPECLTHINKFIHESIALY